MKVWKYLLLSGAYLFVFSNFGIPQKVMAAETGGASGFFGASYMNNPNLSLILDTRVYSSSLSNSELEAKGIPGYTTQGLDMKKGFNLDSAELFFFSP